MHNTSHSPEQLFSSRLIKMKSKPTQVISSEWINQESAAPPNRRAAQEEPKALLFLFQYQLWEDFLLSWEEQTENFCKKPSAHDSISRL